MSEDFVLRTSYEGQLAAEIFVLLFLGSTTSREQPTLIPFFCPRESGAQALRRQLAAETFVLLFLGSTTSREQSTTLGCSVQPPLEL